jgi:hypothetical protein
MADLIETRDWLKVCQRPPYAHDLNPVELAWSHFKRSLANLAGGNLTQLTALVKTRLKRMQYRPGLLEGFLAGAGPDLTLFCSHHERSLAPGSRGAWSARRLRMAGVRPGFVWRLC